MDSLSRLLDGAGHSFVGLYKNALNEFGVDSEADLELLQDGDWAQLGIKPLHRRRILLELEARGGDEPFLTGEELKALVLALRLSKTREEEERERKEAEAAEQRLREEERIRQRLLEAERERKARLIQEERDRRSERERERARQAEEERERLIKEGILKAKRAEQEARQQHEEASLADPVLVQDEEKERLERAERKRLEAQRMAEVIAEKERKRLEKEEKAKKKALERAKSVVVSPAHAASAPTDSPQHRVRKKVTPPTAAANAMAECRDWMMNGKCSKLEAHGVNPAEASSQKLKVLQASGKGCGNLHRPKFRGCLMEDDAYWAMIDNENK